MQTSMSKRYRRRIPQLFSYLAEFLYRTFTHTQGNTCYFLPELACTIGNQESQSLHWINTTSWSHLQLDLGGYINPYRYLDLHTYCKLLLSSIETYTLCYLHISSDQSLPRSHTQRSYQTWLQHSRYTINTLGLHIDFLRRLELDLFITLDYDHGCFRLVIPDSPIQPTMIEDQSIIAQSHIMLCLYTFHRVPDIMQCDRPFTFQEIIT